MEVIVMSVKHLKHRFIKDFLKHKLVILLN
jgi:hypothetical protein